MQDTSVSPRKKRGETTLERAEDIGIVQSELILARIRNCEISKHIKSGDEMMALPNRLGHLIEQMTMQKMKRFKLEVKFLRTWLIKRGRGGAEWYGIKFA